MAEQTAISWCDSTFNFAIGCTKVSPGCDNCYAERDFDLRKHRVRWGAGNPRSRTSEANWKLPLRWNAKPFAQCSACGNRFEPRDASVMACRTCPACGGFAEPARRRVFCASLADWLDNEIPIEWLVDLLDLIERTPNLDWLLLTKRIGNWRRRMLDALTYCRARDVRGRGDISNWIAYWLNGDPPSNVWLGATVVNQDEAYRDVPRLLVIPSEVHFASCEPLLGPMHFGLMHMPGVPKGVYLDWIIVGGESGPKARPMHPDWARKLRDQCQATGTPFHFKQWGEWASVSQVPEQTIDCAYRSNRRARYGEDQSAIDESYGRHCTVQTGVIWLDGSVRQIIEPMAFLEGKGAMSIYRVGKKAAGRLLDGREWNEFPKVHA